MHNTLQAKCGRDGGNPLAANAEAVPKAKAQPKAKPAPKAAAKTAAAARARVPPLPPAAAPERRQRTPTQGGRLGFFFMTLLFHWKPNLFTSIKATV